MPAAPPAVPGPSAAPGAHGNGQPLAALRFGPFLLDRAGARLLRDGQPVDLAPKPWQVLCHLAERPGQLVTKEALLDAVWGHRFVSDSVLKVTVNALRRALGDDARAAAWVQTVARRGYRFSDAVQGVDAAALPRAPSPSSSPSAAPPAAPQAGNLPPDSAGLIGRDALLARLRAEVVSHRLLTLTGPGGVGKSRLALAAAASDAPDGGVWLVRLDALESADAVAAAVARTLGLADAAAARPQALAAALAARPLRLVLDSAEHLAEGLAPQLAGWLQEAPQLSVLVTSQRPLRVAGEQVLAVEPLSVPPADAPPATLAGHAAVALQVRRVQALQPGWVPAASELADCAAIARALDGIPLALELAAARIPLLGAAGVRRRLDARLQMLTGGRADVPARQRTLRAALEWTVGLLPPLALRVLERLSVFAGSFTAEAAQAVAMPALPEADEWAVLDALDLLRDLALVVMPAPPATAGPTQGAASATEPPAAPRLRLLDSVRLLAAERLAAAGDLADARDDHAAWLLRLLADAEPRYYTLGIAHWLAPLEPEVDNLAAAVGHALARLEQAVNAWPAATAAAPDAVPAAATAAAAALGARLASLLALATHMGLRLAMGRSLKAWRDRLDTCLQRGGIALPAPVLAHWQLAGALLGGQGLMPMARARTLGEQAVQALQGSDQPQRLMMALYATGLFQQRMGDRPRLDATLAAMQALLASLGGGDEAVPIGVRRLPGMLAAAVAQHDGDLAAYERHWAGLLAESRARGDHFEAWRAAWSVGQARFLRGDVAGAAAVMDPAMAEVEAAGRLPAQLGFASQALLMRLALDASAPTLDRLRTLLPLLQAAGMLFEALGDALAWVPLHQGRLADALRIQAWADARVEADQVVRSPIVRQLRQAFAARAGQPAGPEPALPLDQDGAIRLALAGTAGV